MNQEKIMKRRMISAIVLFLITLVALLVFIALYVDEVRRVQETYRRQYRTGLIDVVEDIASYRNAEGDFDLRYRCIIKDLDDEKKTINEVNTCLIKYPEQMSGKLEELEKALSDILDGLDKGYEEAQALVDSINKKGY